MITHVKGFLASTAGLVVLGAALAYGIFQYTVLKTANASLATEKQQLAEQLASSTAENEQLAEELRAEKRRLDDLEEEFEEVTETVGNLEKLSALDPELLKKYSKVYFLNENYIPPRLSTISKHFLADGKSGLQVHNKVRSYLENMLEDAEDDGIDMRVLSAYRSFGTQASLKAGYTFTYGTGANAFSAEQGFSEHQLGTTVDLTTPALNGMLDGFETTPAYEWLLDNAYRYGFVLSYPQNNSYYQFEPWHWRFVGQDLARTLHRKKQNFYDMDQREIDKYLIDIFD